MTTVLVVDDEPLIAMALKTALEDEGYSVATAANGKQGLERMSETPRPNVILLDVMMPIMSGPAMLAAMACQSGPGRNSRHPPDLPAQGGDPGSRSECRRNPAQAVYGR